MNADFVGGELVVDLSHGVDLVLNLLLVEWVKVELDVLLTVKADSGGFSSDGSRVALFNNNLRMPRL